MKRAALTVGSLLMSITMVATAGDRTRYRDTAKVIDVEPVYRTVETTEPERDCWNVEVERYEPEGKRYTGTVLGGIIGGVVANSVSRGRGRGRDAATVAGTLLGGAIGHDISQRHRKGRYVTSQERRCQVTHNTHLEERLVGYDVTYRYKGRIYNTFTEEYPGDRIPVQVSVRPGF
jgi:uncharacterized protein YcfJ